MPTAPLRIDGYAPIADYAALGNGHTAALVARDGTVDWLPLPSFDSPAVFSALLDSQAGGRFELAPAEPFEVARRYLPRTNVLESTFTGASGSVRVTDALIVREAGPLAATQLARKVEGLSGALPMRWRIEPRFEWGAVEPEIERLERGLVMHGPGPALVVMAWEAGDAEIYGGGAAADFEATEGSRALLMLSAFVDEPMMLPPRDTLEERFEETIAFWHRWEQLCRYEGPWRDAVRRAALTLKLLVHSPTGAILAAPTSSLPEAIGGSRNFDYRYCWLRDTAFTLEAMLRLGYHEQVHASLRWILRATRRTHPRLSVFYHLDGSPPGEPVELGLEGYRHSRPVLVGNSAGGQFQLGNFGDLMQTAWLYVQDGNALDRGSGRRLAEVADFVCEVWRKPDAGIWELTDSRDHTQGKLSAWLALDRAARLAERGEVADGRAARWRETARTVDAYIRERCWSAELGAFRRDARSEELDASILLASRVDYLDGADPRLAGTIDALRRELADGPFMYRYSGMQGEEGAFLACSFWLVEALARCGKVDDAGELMNELVGLSNDIGLYPEEIDPGNREFLGNFPQALTHLSLANAAVALSEAGAR